MPKVNTPDRMQLAAKEIAAVINKYNLEGFSGTPDFIIADYLISCLKSLNTLIKQREAWYNTWNLNCNVLT